MQSFFLYTLELILLDLLNLYNEDNFWGFVLLVVVL